MWRLRKGWWYGGNLREWLTRSMLTSLFYHRSSRINFFNPFSLWSGLWTIRKGNWGQAPWCERCESFEGWWHQGNLCKCRQVCWHHYSIISHLLLIFSSLLFWRMVAWRKALWVADKKYADIIILLSVISYWLFQSLLSVIRGIVLWWWKPGSSPWCERCAWIGVIYV